MTDKQFNFLQDMPDDTHFAGQRTSNREGFPDENQAQSPLPSPSPCSYNMFGLQLSSPLSSPCIYNMFGSQSPLPLPSLSPCSYNMFGSQPMPFPEPAINTLPLADIVPTATKTIHLPPQDNAIYRNEYSQLLDQSHLISNLQMERKSNQISQYNSQNLEEVENQIEIKSKSLEPNLENSTGSDHRPTCANSHLGPYTNTSGESNAAIETILTGDSSQTSEDTCIPEPQGFSLIAKCPFSEIIMSCNANRREIALSAQGPSLVQNLAISDPENTGEIFIFKDNLKLIPLYNGPLQMIDDDLYHNLSSNFVNRFTILEKVKHKQELKSLYHMNSNYFGNKKNDGPHSLQERFENSQKKLDSTLDECRAFYNRDDSEILALIEENLTYEFIVRYFLNSSRKETLNYKQLPVYLDTKVSMLESHLSEYSSKLDTVTAMFYALSAIKDIENIKTRMRNLGTKRIDKVRNFLESKYPQN